MNLTVCLKPVAGVAPALDVHEDKDKFTVNLEVPDSNAKTSTCISKMAAWSSPASGKEETTSEGTEVHRQERYYGKFSRALTLPTAVAADKVSAAYKDGILTVTLPKAEEAKPKQIDVNIN